MRTSRRMSRLLSAFAITAGCLLAFPLSTGSAAKAAQHYIRQEATGTSDGSSWTNACPDFAGSCAISSLVRGDRYYVAAGTYCASGCIWNTPDSGSSVITIKRATISDHGPSGDWNNSYDGTVTWTALPSGGAGMQIKTDYWTFEGQTGSGGDGPAAVPYGFVISSDFGFALAVLQIGVPSPGTSITNITINHMEVSGVNCCDISPTSPGPSGIYAVTGTQTASNFSFGNVYVHDTKSDPYAFSTASNVTLDHCWTARNRSTIAEHSQGLSIQGTATNFTLSFDTWEDISGTASAIAELSGSLTTVAVYGNTVFVASDNTNYTGTSAFIRDNGTGSGIIALIAYNNTIFNLQNHADVNAGIFSHSGSASFGWIVENNLWFNDIQASMSDSVSTHDYNTLLNTLYAGDTIPQAHEYQTNLGSTNPFVNSASKNFKLSSDTIDPHLNDGIPLAAPYNVDPSGLTRGAGGAWDRGAYQTRSVPPTSLRVTSVQ